MIAVANYFYKHLEDHIAILLKSFISKSSALSAEESSEDDIIIERAKRTVEHKETEEAATKASNDETGSREGPTLDIREPSTPGSAYDRMCSLQGLNDGSSLASPREDNLPEPVNVPRFTALVERSLLASIKRIIESKQAEEVKEFRKLKQSGKISWVKTHFIFALDCSGSMKGTRWDSVIVGLSECLDRIKRMKHVCVSAFTFDIKPNPFCRERSPHQAIANSSQIPFTGKGTDYKRALKYAIALIRKSRHPDYLVCIMFLSDGLGGCPNECIEELKEMREKGKKILFYTIACDTEEETEMMKMANELQGEHYKVTDPQAAKLVFAAILNV
eukprot:TRINITY_DN12560_c0_g1_i2.p1 TRINITY_DN12560_c0_g1~~TRINITY_DN12560_c0_g1_i2.p1  ORF type:complete len:332 (+),score=88.07 TRINITY_DN12560_c0_g1_i2:755-1750(+)